MHKNSKMSSSSKKNSLPLPPDQVCMKQIVSIDNLHDLQIGLFRKCTAPFKKPLFGKFPF